MTEKHQEAQTNSQAQGGSSNVSDTGFFSIQVLEVALRSFDLPIVPLSRKIIDSFDYSSVNGFVCNFQHHWYCIRNIAGTWVRLDSLEPIPEILSETMIQLTLRQLLLEDYQVFGIGGNLPKSEYEVSLSTTLTENPLNDPNVEGSAGYGARERAIDTEGNSSDDEDLKLAIALSMSMME